MITRYWTDLNKCKPELGETVLIFQQGYGANDDYWSCIEIAIFIKNPNNMRKRVFADPKNVSIGGISPWIFTDVTHWMHLPDKPEKIEFKKGSRLTHGEVKRRLKESYSICFECARRYQGAGSGPVTCWSGECCICEQVKQCCAVSDFHWPKRYEIGYVFD